MYLLGFDVGSSSIKATLLDAGTGMVVASATEPGSEMPILAHHPGWAEQDPGEWWRHLCTASRRVMAESSAEPSSVAAIGISYQMHGLVVVDRDLDPLRPSIIWCDSRAVSIGDTAFNELGKSKCLEHFMNSPGNFTASKLKWVRENEPDIFSRIYKAMLPGDYIAMRMTGEVVTTPSGLSEGILWDYRSDAVADTVLSYFSIPPEMIPEVRDTFSVQGELHAAAARELGLVPGIPVAYRAGDQPNNAFSLNVRNAGEIAATAGTSGVVYGVADTAVYDVRSRVNTFVHVNHTRENPRYGVLLCINGTGILNSWLRHTCFGATMEYDEMNALAATVPAGSDGLMFVPFGNGAERSLDNKSINASLHGLVFTRHTRAHMARAAQESIVYSLRYGVDIMHDMGVPVHTVRAGRTNMFQSPLFRQTFATLLDATVELYNTDGSQGAARGAGLGAGVFGSPAEAYCGLERLAVIEPDRKEQALYTDLYGSWRSLVTNYL